MSFKSRRPDRIGEHRTAFDKNRLIVIRTQEICGICGQPVDKNIKPPHPLSPTVDHIIPVSKGGHPSDLANLQLAHRWCNMQKRDRLVVEAHLEEDRLSAADGIDNDNLPQHLDWSTYVAK